MEKIIFHIDVNNAFLSWTAINLLNKGVKTDIRNIEAVIGGDESQRRGIVVAKSMPAKKKGVKTAETLYSARKKCKNLKVYQANYSFYKEMSDKLFSLISNYSPDIEIVSIDECFLDYTNVKNLYGDPISFAHTLKNEIYNTLGFSVNIGIAQNKLCAKMASDFEKPNKVHTLWPYEIKKKLWPLQVGKLYGVGKKSAEKLQQLHINTIYDLAHANENMLYKYFKNNTNNLIKSANGENDEPVITEKRVAKGISNSTTLKADCESIIKMNQILLQLSENVALSLYKNHKQAHVVAVQIKDAFFKIKSHQIKLLNSVSTSKEIYEVAKRLLKILWKGEPVRLMGLRVDHLTDVRNYQVSLFEDPNLVEENKELESVIMRLKEKYGVSVITKAVSIDTKISKKYND